MWGGKAEEKGDRSPSQEQKKREKGKEGKRK